MAKTTRKTAHEELDKAHNHIEYAIEYVGRVYSMYSEAYQGLKYPWGMILQTLTLCNDILENDGLDGLPAVVQLLDSVETVIQKNREF